MSCGNRALYSQRTSPSSLPEWMDAECSYADFKACLLGLQQVNRLFLGHRPTLEWLRSLSLPDGAHIVDVGFGGGDLLRRVRRWANTSGISVTLTGIDLNPHAAQAARDFTPAEAHIDWLTGDALTIKLDQPVDVIVSSLMTHHLENDQIVSLLRWMELTARTGWFINDLERSRVNSALFKLIAKVCHWDKIVQHDGPVSFARAFSKADWSRLLNEAELPESATAVDRWFPGRLCVGRLRR